MPYGITRPLWTRYVDGTPTSEVTPATIRYIHRPTTVSYPKVTVTVTNDWLTSVSFHVNHSQSWNKAISTFDLETSRSRSWVWSKGKTYSQLIIKLICFLFVSHQSDNNCLHTAILKWDLGKSKVKVMGKVKGQGHIVHPVSNQCTSFLLHVDWTNHSWDMSKRVFDLEKTHPKFLKNIR